MKIVTFLKDMIKEMRVKSWLKNLFVLIPIVFSLELFERERLIGGILLTLAFCFVSSAVYIFNDIKDLEKDRNHEVKRNRPIAAGRISVTAGWILTAVLLAIGFVTAYFVKVAAFLIIVSYVFVNILYSTWLKRMPIVDCFCIAAGFVLRVLTGGTAVESGVSDWMFLTVIAFSLFMALGKRRGEMVWHIERDTRTVLESYEQTFLNGSTFMCAGLTVVFYSLWCLSQGAHLVYTVPIILFIVLRYLLLLFKGKEEGDPTGLILGDRTLLIACGLCSVIMLVILYAPSLLSSL